MEKTENASCARGGPRLPCKARRRTPVAPTPRSPSLSASEAGLEGVPDASRPQPIPTPPRAVVATIPSIATFTPGPCIHGDATGASLASLTTAPAAPRLESRTRSVRFDEGFALVEACGVDDLHIVRPATGDVLDEQVATARSHTSAAPIGGEWRVATNELIDEMEGVGRCAADW